jgi:hypothetical protein
MRKEAHGAPEVGPTGRTLGARPGTDIKPDKSGMVKPETGGMSASPGSPYNLPEHRRPPKFGGTGKDPVFCIGKCDLGPDLRFRPDPKNPTGHGFIEPARPMSIDEYQRALEATRGLWKEVP